MAPDPSPVAFTHCDPETPHQNWPLVQYLLLLKLTSVGSAPMPRGKSPGCWKSLPQTVSEPTMGGPPIEMHDPLSVLPAGSCQSYTMLPVTVAPWKGALKSIPSAFSVPPFWWAMMLSCTTSPWV